MDQDVLATIEGELTELVALLAPVLVPAAGRPYVSESPLTKYLNHTYSSVHEVTRIKEKAFNLCLQHCDGVL